MVNQISYTTEIATSKTKNIKYFMLRTSHFNTVPWANPRSKDALLSIMASSISYPWKDGEVNLYHVIIWRKLAMNNSELN